MSEKYKMPDNIGKIIQAKIPEIKKDFADMGNNTYSIVNKAIISMQENIDDKLCEYIREVAMDNGIDTVYVMDKKFIAEAIKHHSPMLVDRYTHEIQLERPGDFGLQDTPICPNCKETLKFWHQKFCEKCGQHISWENCDGYHFKDRKSIFDDMKRLEDI